MNYTKDFLGSQATINSRTWGELTFEAASFTDAIDGDLVVIVGKPFEQKTPLVRIHSECVFSEIFDSDLCDCGDQLQLAMKRLTVEQHGLLFYLRLDGRGAGLAAKVKATALEVKGIDTYDSRIEIGVSPKSRDFQKIGIFLIEHGIKTIKLLTNNPNKGRDIEKRGLEIIYEPLLINEPSENVKQLYHTKATKFNHFIPDFLQK